MPKLRERETRINLTTNTKPETTDKIGRKKHTKTRHKDNRNREREGGIKKLTEIAEQG